MTTDEEMLRVYRHDAHKTRGRPHAHAVDELAGVPVNLKVPYGADANAAALSRPSGSPSQTVETYESHYRLSLLSGESRYDPESFNIGQYRDEIHDLLSVEDALEMHERWLTSELMGAFNESVHYPYTSLKYHTLLVAALVANYRRGAEFEDLWVVVDGPDEITPHRTIFAGETFNLRVTANPAGEPRARLGSRPWRSWASTWERMTEHPQLLPEQIDQRHRKREMFLDAQLRRIQAWSTALQYIEDFVSELGAE